MAFVITTHTFYTHIPISAPHLKRKYCLMFLRIWENLVIQILLYLHPDVTNGYLLDFLQAVIFTLLDSRFLNSMFLRMNTSLAKTKSKDLRLSTALINTILKAFNLTLTATKLTPNCLVLSPPSALFLHFTAGFHYFWNVLPQIYSICLLSLSFCNNLLISATASLSWRLLLSTGSLRM